MDLSGNKSPLERAEIERIINNELTDEYERLRWTPGFCLDRMSWERLTELIQVRRNMCRGAALPSAALLALHCAAMRCALPLLCTYCVHI